MDIKILSIFILFCFLLSQCGIYNYTSPHTINKIKVNRIKNNAKTHSTDIDYIITRDLEDKLRKQNDLDLVGKNAGFEISGAITNYTIEPISVGDNDKVCQNRIAIALSISLIDIYNVRYSKPQHKNIETFVDYDPKKHLEDVRDSINNLLSQELADMVYSEFFLKW